MSDLPGAQAGSRLSRKIMVLILVLVPLILFVLSVCYGRYWISPSVVLDILFSKLIPVDITWSGLEESVVMSLRVPRVLLVMLVGAGLAVAGASFQGLFGNPLVSPDILGVSAGAGFGAALGIMLCDQMAVIQILAFAFGIMAVIITYAISHLKTGTPLFMLVLSGVITGAFFQAMISLIKYLADPHDKLPAIIYWLMGSMAGATYQDLLIGAPIIMAGIVILLLLRWRINILSLDEEEARSLGVDVQRLRWLVIFASTIITATAVSLCGIVGWVGLVIPHIGRMLVGPDHRRLLPVCVSLGACFLVLIDNIARAATSSEIPLSILTAVIGAPFFAYLLRKTGGLWS